MKRGGPDHPKTKRIVRNLHVPIYSAVGILEMLFHFAGKHAPRGDIGRFTDREIAEAVGWHGDSTRFVQALHQAGTLDAHPLHRWVIHDWPEHADNAVKKLLKRQGLTWAVSGQGPVMSGQNVDMDGPPLPLPIPEPLPLPVLARETRPDVDLSDIATEMYQRHKQGRKTTLIACQQAIVQKVGSAVNPLNAAAALNERHRGWCASKDWTKQCGEFAPWLDQWIIGKKADAEPPVEEKGEWD